MKNSFFILLALFSLSVQAKDRTPIASYFNHLSHAEKYMYLKSMPKSGELHTHLGGSVYPETMIALAKNYCLTSDSYTINPSNRCKEIRLKDLPNHPDLYADTVRAWSMKDFNYKKGSGHDHFFNTFTKFYPFVTLNQPSLIADTLNRAIAQNESYIELMITPDLNQASKFSTLVDTRQSLEHNYRHLMKNTEFKDHINYAVNRLYDIDNKAQALTISKQTPCHTVLKYQYYILRDQPMDAMIAQAVAAFETTNRSTKLVGVNFVQAEDAYRPLKFYKEQMKVFAFLHAKYPKVNISLHAGELNPKTIDSNAMTFHIHDAILIGQAERIGHGTDIAFEDNALSILNTMRKKDIPVEINLTSNEKILNSSPKTHPLPLYLHHHVPVVLSTDDEGILRTTLTDEYLKAVEDYHVSYEALKQINRNGLSYAFMPGHSIWASNNTARPVSACKKSLNSMQLDNSCDAYLQHNFKARLQWQLEKALVTFETKIMKQA